MWDGSMVVSPFQGLVLFGLPTQGGASRLCRSALPWAGLFRPLRGEVPRAASRERKLTPTSNCTRVGLMA